MNPFNYQGPVEPHALIDRRLELDALQSAAADRVAIRLAAPRRFGKTSLLNAHIASMRTVGHRAVRIDLSKVANVGDVAARVADSFSLLPNDPHRSVQRWAARLGVTAKLPGVQLFIAPSAARPGPDEARAALLELLDVPLALHQADGAMTIVCLDEFQDLLVADDALDGLFRSVIQHHAAAAAYVFAGSQPSLMRALFSERERPFYGQARPLELPPLPVDEAARDIEALLRADGLDPGSAVDELIAFTGGTPATHCPTRPPPLQPARPARPARGRHARRHRPRARGDPRRPSGCVGRARPRRADRAARARRRSSTHRQPCRRRTPRCSQHPPRRPRTSTRG